MKLDSTFNISSKSSNCASFVKMERLLAINICEITHISQSVFFSFCAILNLCDSQLVFFSISAILNLCFSQLVFFSICAFLN